MKLDHESKHFVFLLIPGFSLVALSCAVDALRAANVESGETLFQWTMVAENVGEVASSSGISISCIEIIEDRSIDVLVVCGGERSHLFASSAVDSWLKICGRRHMMIGSISDGAYVVAAAGLFNAHRSTIHWKCQSPYRERFPDLDVRTSIMEIDRNRFSCAGGTASLDLMLHFIAHEKDNEFVGRIADNYFHDVVRNEEQLQPMTSRYRFAARNRTVSDALLIMDAELEAPSPISNIAKRLHVSHRQLDRLFKRYLETSPGQYYRGMRLARAAGLLRQTELSTGEIALGCGFQSSSHLSGHFKSHFGVTPHQYRGRA